MQNSYIIDAFLSGLACFMLVYFSFNTISRLRQLNNLIDANAMAAAIGVLWVRSVVLAIPISALLTFALWRTYTLMLFTQTWGYGGMGLLITMAITGILTIWLNVLLVCVCHSGFVPQVPASPPPRPHHNGGFQ